ncbi:MAG: cytochrome c biogenesis heme-transporting ATPase CcmA [Chromatiales bacterium]|nr:MAG: cytochrome c biogenesis heme-transporting ATPase CcmA [Chromatiales bacterium]
MINLSNDAMLVADELTLWRGELCLFDGLSVAVEPGQALMVRGPNGAGKTTLLRVLCGLTRPEAGQVHWCGEPVETSGEQFGRALAYCGHQTGLKADLSLAGNLAFAARLAGLHGEPWRDIMAQLGLASRADLLVRHLSAGQQRRGALVRALMVPAQLWVFDEPFTNLDAAGRDWLEARLDAHLDRGGMAIIAAHHELRPRPGLRTLELAEAR